MNKEGIYLKGDCFYGWCVVAIDSSGVVISKLTGQCETAEEALRQVMVASSEPVLIR